MTLTTYAELEQGSQEWLDARCGLMTASNIGKLITPSTLKVADNETSRGLTMQLAAERITGHVDFVYPTADMQRGTDDEPFARNVYAANFSPVEQVGFMVRDFGDYKIGYSPDGLVGDDGLIEIKSRRPKEHLKTVLKGLPPLENMAQMMAGMLVSGREWCDYVSFCAGLPLWVRRVHLEDRWVTAIHAAAEQFEINATNIVNNFTAATDGLPMTERRASIEEITF